MVSPIELKGHFEPIEKEDHQLSGIKNTSLETTRQIITFEELRHTFYELSFKHVAYGTFKGSPTCFILMKATFDAPERGRHRFKSVTVEIDFVKAHANDVSVVVLEHAPELMYGKTTPENHETKWSVGTKFSLSVPGIPATFDVFDAKRGETVSYSVDRAAKLNGARRGFPRHNRVVWTVQEGLQDGIGEIPLLAMLVRYPVGQQFKANISLAADIGFSINPQRWSIFARPDEPVIFDEKEEIGEPMDPNFDSLDITSFLRA